MSFESRSPPICARDCYHPVQRSARPSPPTLVPASDFSQNEAPRPPLHWQEVALVGITALHLCFLPWALGTVHTWSQFTSLGFAVVGFILAMWPRREQISFNAAPRLCRSPAVTLLLRPVFWAGLTLLGYIAVQGSNPAWRFLSNDTAWWLERTDSITWLPTSVAAPFDRANSWRALTIFGSLALLVCSVWAGLSRRKSYLILFTMLTTNACILSWLGLAQRMSGATKIFWSYVPSNKAFAASFIYPNHAGSYLNLIVALAVGLAWWHAQRTRKRLENPGLAVVFIFFALSIATMVIFTYSRMSIVLLVTFGLFLCGNFVLQLTQRKRTARGRPEIMYLSLALAALLCFGLVAWQTGKIRKRFSGMVTNPESALLDRTVPRQAAEKMFRDHWFFGWGAGCFQYGFTKYMKEYSEKEYRDGGLHLFWEHAHDDLLEFPAELGVAGMIPLIGILGYAGWQLYRRRFWRNVVSLLMVLGCILVVVHASVDFVFQDPAILLTWSVLLVGALRWVELDQPRSRQVVPRAVDSALKVI